MPNELWLLVSAGLAVLIVVARILVGRRHAGQHSFADQALPIHGKLVDASNKFIEVVQPGLEFAGTDPFAVPKAYQRFQEMVEEAKATFADLPAPGDARSRRLANALRSYLEVVEGPLAKAYGDMVQLLKSADRMAVIQLSCLILAAAEPEKKAREAFLAAASACDS